MRLGFPLAALAAAVCGCGEPVLRSGSEPEVNRAVAALQVSGIPVEVQSASRGRETSFEIVVDRDDAGRARAILSALGLPRSARAGQAALGEGSGIVPSPVEERARIAAAIAGDVEQSLDAIDGVVETRVHVAFPLADDPAFSLDQAVRPSRASVLVRHLTPAPPIPVEDVRRLVAGAVDSLDPAAVEVVFDRVVLPASSDRDWEALGPFTVRSGSRVPLLVLIVGLLGAVAALAAVLVWSRISRRRAAAQEARADTAR